MSLPGDEGSEEDASNEHGDLTLASFGLNLQSRGRTEISDGLIRLVAHSLSFVQHSSCITYMIYYCRFENVPLIAPNGSVLIENVSFEIKHGENVLVRGSNGCGKSSLFRVLGGLWPVFSGTVVKPARRNLFYIPQVRFIWLYSWIRLFALDAMCFSFRSHT